MKSKTQKREEALLRQQEYDKLSVSQRMALLPKDGARRQRAKIQALIDKGME